MARSPFPTSAHGPCSFEGAGAVILSGRAALAGCPTFSYAGAMFELSIDGAVGRLRLNRPQARNAIPLDGWRAIADMAEEALRSGARILIVSGPAEGAFCAGADLRDFGRFREDAAARRDFREEMRSGLDRLRDVPLATLAVVEGACYGAGVALAMACDLRFAGPGAQFAITPAKLGISYPQEDVHRLVSLIGPGQASRLLFAAESMDGREAERIRLVERYFATGLAEAAEAFARSVASNEAASVAALKRGVGLAAAGVAQNKEQEEIFDELLGGEPLLERLQAHRSRRR